jgi:hypothetical protein
VITRDINRAGVSTTARDQYMAPLPAEERDLGCAF